jgi:3-phosphoshikimate 1-carboxyvinyltransferase
LRVKESDRIAVIATQLNNMGAKVTELPDGLEIVGGTPLIGTDVDSHTDHRIAMSLAIAALNATNTTTIHGAEALLFLIQIFLLRCKKFVVKKELGKI